MKESYLLKDIYNALIELRHDISDLRRLVESIQAPHNHPTVCESGAAGDECVTIIPTLEVVN